MKEVTNSQQAATRLQATWFGPRFRVLATGYSSSWSSPECSPPCQGGGRGFKSRRGRSARYANRKSGEAQTFVIVCGFDSHPCYSRCVGWVLASPGGCNPPATGCGGSIPVRRTLNTARSSNGSGCRTFTPAIRVRIPCGLLTTAGTAGARLALIRPVSWFDSGTCNQAPWSNGTIPGRHPGDDGSTPSGAILTTARQWNEPLVQGEDSWFATRESGFDSPAVH